MKFLVKLVVVALMCGTAGAANQYVRDGASGNGSDWTNAYDDLPSVLTRGDTYFIADGSYSSYTFNDALSGTTIITIKKAIESAHGTDTGWLSAYGDGVATFGNNTKFDTEYITFDGVVGGGPGSYFSGHGFKITVPSGTGSKGIRVRSSNLVIAHLEIAGPGNANQGIDGIYGCCAGAPDNNTFQYVWVHDMGRALMLILSGKNYLVEYSAFQRPGSVSGQHSEIWSITGNFPNDWTVRYNIFTDPISTGGLLTSGLRWEVYGNLFTNTSTNGCPCNAGIFGGFSAEPGGQHKFYNNTIVDMYINQGRLFGTAGGSGSETKNNIFFNVDNYLNNSAVKSHNAFGDTGNPGETEQQLLSDTGSDIFVTYGAVNFQPGTDDFHLVASTDAGVTLASPFDTDLDGVTRGVDGIWDRGTFEKVTGGPEPSNNLVMDFTGIITSVIDSSSFLPPAIEVGDTVTGTFCYTTNLADRDTSSEWGDYRFNKAPDTLTVTVEGITWQPTSRFTLQTLVRNGSASDRIAIGLRGIDMPVGLDSSENSNHSFMQFALVDTDASVFSDDTIPTALTLSNFEQGIIEILVTHNITTGAFYRILVETVSTLVVQ